MIIRSKINIHNLKKSLGIFMVFFTISLFITVVTFYILSFQQDIIKSNECLSDKFITVSFQNASNIDKSTFMNTIENEKNIILYKNFAYSDTNSKNSTISGNGIYFNKTYFNNIPVIDGRFFNVKDSQSNDPMIVLGKSLLNKTVTKDNKKYFLYDDIYYRVIGTIGYKNKSSMYDKLFIINLKSYIYNTEDFRNELNDNWKIDDIDGNPRKTLTDIYNKLNKLDSGVQINTAKTSIKYNPLKDTLDKSKSIIIILAILILVLFCNVVNITHFWIMEKRKEIGVRKALGGTNKDIALKIMLEYQFIAIIAALSAIILVSLLKKHASTLILLDQSNFNQDIYIHSVLVILVFSLLLGMITALIPMKQIMKMEANDIIRGR